MTIRPQSYFKRWEREWLWLWQDKHTPFGQIRNGQCLFPVPNRISMHETHCCGAPTQSAQPLCLFHADLKQSREAQRAA